MVRSEDLLKMVRVRSISDLLTLARICRGRCRNAEGPLDVWGISANSQEDAGRAEPPIHGMIHCRGFGERREDRYIAQYIGPGCRIRSGWAHLGRCGCGGHGVGHVYQQGQRLRISLQHLGC